VARLLQTDTRDRLLSIYLNDHRAGAAAGVALARRIVRQSDVGEAKAVVQAIADEIADDRRTLERIARLTGVRANPAKIAAARLAERLGRLKLNGRLRGRSPLSRVIELEGLMAGIDAKRSLWVSLQVARRPEWAEIDFENLASRATDQRARLVPLHRSAAADALRTDGPLLHAVRATPSVD
jgi:hypothetical protein